MKASADASANASVDLSTRTSPRTACDQCGAYQVHVGSIKLPKDTWHFFEERSLHFNGFPELKNFDF